VGEEDIRQTGGEVTWRLTGSRRENGPHDIPRRGDVRLDLDPEKRRGGGREAVRWREGGREGGSVAARWREGGWWRDRGGEVEG
jgi:hypothetical protein